MIEKCFIDVIKMIEKYSIDVKKVDTIEGIKPLNCINNFIDYIDQELTDDVDKFERNYINALKKNIIEGILEPFYKDKYKDYSKDELYELVVDFVCGNECGHAYYDDIQYLHDDLRDNFEDEELFPYIQQYMLNTFDEICKSNIRIKKENEIKDLEAKINYNKDLIEKAKKASAELEEQERKLTTLKTTL